MNIHSDNPDIPNTKQMKNMAGFDLKQHVDVPTHTAGYTLDLLFTRDDPMHPLLKSISVTDLRISDLYVVKCKLYTSPPPRPNKA